MSLITCCPACGTMFRVVPDQLRISEGWVRCGHCSEVFDATASLVAEAPSVPADPRSDARPAQGVHASEPAPVASPPRAAAVPAAPPPAQAPAQGTAPAAAPAPVRATPAPVASPPPPPPVAPVASDAVESDDLSPDDAPFVFRRSDMGHADEAPSVSPPLSAPAPASARAAARAPADADLADDAPPALQDVGFIRAARRRAFWSRPSVRVLLVLAGLALAALLGLQMAVHERDRLAAFQPATAPLLARLCEPLRCTVGPPRLIDDIAIETSAFSRLRNDAYRLSFSLRNEARVAVSMPSMELTLTDAQDQPVVRRVLSPADFAGGQQTLAAAGEWSGGIALVVTVPGGGRIAGYRLLAFYP